MARLLPYDVQPPGGAPDAVIEFHDLLISSSQSFPDPVQPLERHSFNFATLSQPAPEPASVALMGMAVMFVGGMSCRRGRKHTV